MPRRRKSWPARIAAPAALLVAATVAVLLVRDGLRRSSSDSPPPVATTTTTTTPRPPGGRARYYTIRLGDTLSLIAEQSGTSVERLEQLNPGVDTANLVPGRRLRIE